MTDASTHPFDDALVLEAKGEGLYAGVIAPAYWHIAGPFGGIIAAVLLKGVLDHPALRGRPVAQTANLCAAMTRDPFEMHVRLVRDGRSAQHWLVELNQNGAVAATCSIVTGPTRETWAHQPASAPPMPAPDGMTPFASARPDHWTARYDMRFERGSPANPDASAEKPGSAQTRLWLRDEPPRPLDYAALATMADAFILRLLQVRGAIAPSATVTLTTYFMASEGQLATLGAAPVIGVADTRVFAHGFHDQSAELWGADGKLLAVSHQLVWFRE